MPPNFGTKEILFRNYHVRAPDRPVVTGKESWGSTIHRCPYQTMSPCFKKFSEHYFFTGVWTHPSKPAIKWLSDPGENKLNNPAMSPFYLFPRAFLTPLDPTWSILLLCRSWVVRRILVHGVIVSLILAPCRARGSAIAARKILVISPESSLHARKAILVFARIKMCGHLPLVYSTECPLGKPHASSP